MISLIMMTFHEALAKKFILLIFILISLFLILFLGFLNLDTTEAIAALMEATGKDNFRGAIISFENSLISPAPFFIVFTLFIILTSSFIPSMLKKGEIEILLSKPISRAKIIIGKYLATNILIFFILTYLIGIIWLMISIKTNVWHFPFLYSIIWFTLIFVILNSLISLTGLITQSSIISILLNTIFLFPISGVLALRVELYKIIQDKIVRFIIDVIYYILPKPWDLREMCINIIEGNPIESWQPVITSVIFCLAVLTYSIYYFSKKDY